jgi:hypothetical protein
LRVLPTRDEVLKIPRLAAPGWSLRDEESWLTIRAGAHLADAAVLGGPRPDEYLLLNGVEAQPIRRVGIAVPPIAAIVEWLRINALPDGLPYYQLKGDVDADLREICDGALARR